MTSFFRPALQGLLLATAIAASVPLPASAGELNSSEATFAISAVLILGAPLVVSGGIADSATTVADASRSGAADKPKDKTKADAKAGPLPPLQVRQVTTADDGGRRVDLQDPLDPANTAQLRWPKHVEDPASGFVVGDVVQFVPSPAGAGWTVHAPDGKALAYAPTAQAADDNLSGRW